MAPATSSPAAPQTHTRIEQLFAAQALATPERIAVLHRGRRLTYAELAARADHLAARLRAAGVGPGVLAGVCMGRTERLLVALLAVLQAGGGYLPLDPAYPRERLGFMLGDSGASLLLTDGATGADLGFAGALFEISPDSSARLTRAGQVRACAPEGLAYVIYTSGSTGRPKGVMLGHSATRLIAWARTAFVRGELERVAATTSVCFDPSIFEIFAPLCTGGTVLLKENGLEPFARDEAPSMLNGVPSMFAQLCRAGAIPDSVRVINVGGEPLSAALVREIYARTQVEAVFNHYGPTEATTCATVALAARDLTADPPIGRPIAGAAIHLLDAAGRPVGPGELGEIHIGGGGLALGYVNQPELTAQRFVASPWGRLYRTGDFARCSPDGDLRFEGRADEQVKVRGFRIELAEVESALLRIPSVARAVAAVRKEDNGRAELLAFVEAAAPLSEREVRTRLRAWLPQYMQPDRILTLERFPLTLSGKVDRNALLRLPARPATGGAAAQSRIEEAIGQVFGEVLGLKAVGAEDSFFALGGDSLAAVNASLRLQELLGHELPAALLHHAPSPRELAAALEDCPLDDASQAVVLQSGGEGPPLVCLSDLFGRPLSYLSLARQFCDQRPVLGLAPGAAGEALIASGSIAELTRALGEELRRRQPDGPYLLVGYSAGGVLAFDLACALQRQGQSAALVLVDSVLWSSRPSPGQFARWAAEQALDAIEPNRMADRLRRLPALTNRVARVMAPPRAAAPHQALPDWVPPSKRRLATALISACSSYRPRRFEGPALLIKAAEHDRVDALADRDGKLGWARALAGRTRVVELPGNHHSLMREPLVDGPARAIASFADEVCGRRAETAPLVAS